MSLWHTIQNAFCSSKKSKHNNDIDIAPNGVVTNATYIATILKDICFQKSIIAIKVPGINKIASTSILSVDQNSNQFAIDDTTDNTCNNALKTAKKIYFYAHFDFVPFNFHCTFIKTNTTNGKDYHVLRIPKEASYRQRRQDHRISIRGIKTKISCYYQHNKKRQLFGYVNDISERGISITLNGILEMKPSDQLKACAIEIEKYGRLNTCITIQNISANKASESTRIGGMFTKMSRLSKKRLHTLLIEHERALAQQAQNTNRPTFE